MDCVVRSVSYSAMQWWLYPRWQSSCFPSTTCASSHVQAFSMRMSNHRTTVYRGSSTRSFTNAKHWLLCLPPFLQHRFIVIGRDIFAAENSRWLLVAEMSDHRSSVGYQRASASDGFGISLPTVRSITDILHHLKLRPVTLWGLFQKVSVLGSDTP